MTQRTFARIWIWIMILAGIVFLTNIFIVPRFANLLSQMSDGETKLPFIMQVVLNLSSFSVYHGLFLGTAYIVLFIAVIVWFCKTTPKNQAI